MSLENRFLDKPVLQTMSANLKEYTPLVTCGEITVYRHKSNRTYYISPHGQGTRPIYSTTENDCLRFRTLYRYLMLAYIERKFTVNRPRARLYSASISE